MRQRHHKDSVLVAYVLDVLWLEEDDLRTLPLRDRRKALERVLQRAKAPLLLVEQFADGGALFAHCEAMGLEGVVSKRPDSPYRSGPSRSWVKVKCAGWRERNAQRRQMFDPR